MVQEEEQVVLVDKEDNEIGQAGKLEAHQRGQLHRAISVFVFNSKGEMLLQRRADHKYHSAGLWSNTCCSHPRPSEETAASAHRRLQEEMGLVCELTRAFSFTYRHDFGNGVIEHETDHVFVGRSDDDPQANPEEVSDWRWIAPAILEEELAHRPNAYTCWFRMIVEKGIEPV